MRKLGRQVGNVLGGALQNVGHCQSFNCSGVGIRRMGTMLYVNARFQIHQAFRRDVRFDSRATAVQRVG